MSENQPKIQSLRIPSEVSGERLDRALAKLSKDLSRTRLKHLIQQGLVILAGKPVTDPAIGVLTGQVYKIRIPPATDPRPGPEDIKIDILYEDQDLIVINKPPGLVVHPGAGHATGTLVNALIHHCGESLSGIGGERRPGIVHRLDKDTSGVMVAAKNDASHKHLSRQFADHSLGRKYLALVSGVPAPLSGTIETLIARHPKNRKKMAVSTKKGKAAVTHYKVLKRLRGASLVECTLKTGRTHQVRVHMAHIGNPLIGDPLYSRGRVPKELRGQEAAQCFKNFPRQALHAFYLSFRHPASGKTKVFQSPLPSDMEALLEVLKT